MAKSMNEMCISDSDTTQMTNMWHTCTLQTSPAMVKNHTILLIQTPLSVCGFQHQNIHIP